MALPISRLTSLAVIAAGLAVATPAIAGQLIVRSSGPSAKTYPPGKQLPDSAKIQLRTGDMVILLGAGSTRTLRGPGSFPANAANVALAANRRARFGALRTGELNLNPSPWNIDVSHSGKVCVADPAKLMLWRPDSADTVKLNITDTGGKSASAEWPAGRATLAWPAEMPVQDGGEYQLQIAGTEDVSRVSVATIGAVPPEAIEAAQALIDRGCDNQLDILVNGIDKSTR